MSAFKPFLAQDIIVTPLELNKGFTYDGETAVTSSGIDRFVGQNSTTLFNPLTSATTGNNNIEYKYLVYNSIKELYYSNYLSSSYGDTAIPNALNSLANGIILSESIHQPSYDNYLQSTLTFSRFFPTGANATVGVVSIPKRLYGDRLQPSSILVTSNNTQIKDDGEGNLTIGSDIVGNVIYSHGLLVLTTGSIVDNITGSSISCSFSSSYTIFESQYKCTIRENEFSFTLNPTVLSGSGGAIYSFATGSDFAPYVTTVGLFNENQELLAVGKLSQPLPSSHVTDMNILVNLDLT
jgi:hypothetical protein